MNIYNNDIIETVENKLQYLTFVFMICVDRFIDRYHITHRTSLWTTIFTTRRLKRTVFCKDDDEDKG